MMGHPDMPIIGYIEDLTDTRADEEAQCVHIDLTASEIRQWHTALQEMWEGGIYLWPMAQTIRDMLAEVRNAAASADVDLDVTVLPSL